MNGLRTAAFGAALTLPALPWLTTSPDSQAAPPDDASPAVLVLTQAEDGLTLEELLDAARDVLDIDYFSGVRNEDLSAPMAIYGTPRVAEDQFLEFFERTLAESDFVHYESADGRSHGVSSVRAQGGRRGGVMKSMAPVVDPEDVHALSHRSTLITTHYTTNHLPARDAVNTLQPYFGDNFVNNIRNIEGTKTIVMTGFAYSVSSMLHLLDTVDQASHVAETDPNAPTLRTLDQRLRSLEGKIVITPANSSKDG